MANPWVDAEYARHWDERMTGGGGAFRIRPLDVLCRLAAVRQPRRILELGIGTGLVAEGVRARLPDAEYVGLDASASMLDLARVRLPGVELVEADLLGDWPEVVEGEFDLVVSAQTIHHIEGAAKQDVYEQVFSVLSSRGRFLLSDRLAVEPELFGHYVALWQRTREQLGLDPLPADWTYDRYLEKLAEAGDVPDLLQTQLDWLEEVGFDPVTSFWQDGDRAVFGGIRP
jgi:tRNA (cmo5U34)-methyltransferase